MFGEAQLEQHREAFNQAALADRLILSKTDVATPTRAARIERRLRSLNPVAPIYRVQHGQVDPLVVLDIGSFRFDESPAEFGTWLGLGAGSKVGEEQAKPPHDGHCDDHHDHALDDVGRHGGEVHAHSFFLDGPVGWLAVEAWIDFLRDRFGDDLLRCKGLIEIAGTGKPVLIQGVQTVFDRPLPLAAWPRGLGRSCLVLIGRGLDPDAIAKSLQVLRGCSGPSAADRRKCHDD